MEKLAAITEARSRRRARRRLAGRSTSALLALVGIAAATSVWAWATMIRMPGSTYRGPFAPLSPRERAVEAELRRDVATLAEQIGERSVPRHEGLAAAADHVERALLAAGHRVSRQRYEVRGRACDNVEAEIAGRSREIVIVGAHYDSVAGTTGADDNASGVAALLALARAFSGKKPDKTLRFVAFANEEPPYFQTASMGSVVYAKRSRARGEAVMAMISLETIGLYTDRPGSQHYPFPFGMFYPKVGDFVAVVGDRSSADLVRQTLTSFRLGARFPSEGIAGPMSVPGIGWSDHWSFAQEGYPAVMVTDTAPFRNARYHTTSDTPGELAYTPMARVVVGLTRVIEDLVGMGGDRPDP
jgi:hypothetical protein